MTLVYLALAWCAGLVLASMAGGASAAWWALAGAAAIGVWLARRHPAYRVTFACLLLASLGALRYDAARPPVGPGTLAALNDTGRVVFTGRIVAPPDVRDNHINLRVAADWVRLADAWPDTLNPAAAEGVALVQASRYGRYAYGNRVEVAGSLLTPPRFDTFSYRDYLARQGVLSLVPGAAVDVIAPGDAHALYDLRARAETLIADTLPEPEASLLTGILLGVESGIAPEVRDDFNAAGATHVIAISGFNMSVVALVIARGLSYLLPSRRAAAFAGIVGIAIYTAFVGADPAVMRAAIMSSLLIVAPLLERRTYVPASLAFAALLMTLANPYTLWDVGFQLSVAAVMGMALFVEPLERAARAMLARWFASTTVERLLGLLSEPLIVTVAAQITTIPLIALYFGRLSLASFVVNFLIIPVQAPLMLLGAAAVIVGLVVPGAAIVLFWADWLFLAWTVGVVRLFARQGWASVEVDVGGRVVALLYAALAAGAIASAVRPDWWKEAVAVMKKRALKLGLIAGGLAVAVLLGAAIAGRHDGRLHVRFLDVGGEHAVLVTTPGGAQVLIDGGDSPSRLLAALGGAMPFNDREIELLVVTQPEDAVLSALPAVLDRYAVGAVLTTGQPGDSDAWRALEAALAASGAPVTEVYAGYVVSLGDGVRLEVVHPQARPSVADNPREHGMVLRLVYGDASFLLMPDLIAKAEVAMVRAGWALSAAVLGVPDHGSSYACSPRLLEAVQPGVAVIEVEAGNRQGYPAPAVVERLDAAGAVVYRTDEHGAVTFVSDGRELLVSAAVQSSR